MPPVNIPKQDTEQSADSLFKIFSTNIETWEKRVQSLKQEKEREDTPEGKEALAEIDQLAAFLKGRLTKRLEGIKQFPEELKKQYLRCIEPFYTEEGITRFMTHYFDVEVFKQVRLRYRKKKDFEKEVNILFDLYRVKKTIETIGTLEKSSTSGEPFASRFSKEEQAEFLRTLKEIFKLFFVRFVKKEYRKDLFESLSESNLDIDEIIKMRKDGVSYVTDAAIQTKEYRDKFITVFFSTLLRTKTSSEIKDLHFNFLNFELLKNEFLTDWVQRKLKNSPEKDKVLQNYQIGGKSVAQLIKENPEKEREILTSIPVDAFNDMAEEVNQKVKGEEKTPVTTFSKNHGLFSRLQSSFEAVKQVAKFSVEKMEEMKPKTKIWTVRKKAEGGGKKGLPSKKAEVAKPVVKEQPKEPPKQELKIQYGVEVLTMADIDYPFFDKKIETYKTKLDFLSKKMGEDYQKLKDKIWKLFNLLSKDHFIIRKEPIHEWAIPFIISQGQSRMLLIIGAEIGKKGAQTGYKSAFMKDSYVFNAFYLLGTQSKNPKLGKMIDIRGVKKTPFHVYSHVEKTTQNMAFTLINRLFQTKDKTIFKSSNLSIRLPDEIFEELEEIRYQLGLGEDNNAPAEDSASQESEAAVPEAAAKPATAGEKPKVQDINEVARQLKEEMEAEKNKPVEVEVKKSSGKVHDINEVAAKLKEEMAAEKAKKEAEAEVADSGKAPQKVKDFRQVAAELKQEMGSE